MWNVSEWILCATATLLVLGFLRFRRSVNMVSNFPGLRLLISPMSTPGLLLPSLPFPYITYPGFSFPWEFKHKAIFAKFKCDTVSLCAADGRAILFTADVPFITRMSSYASREIFPKPVEEYAVLSYLGSNLVICEGDSWRRQRRIGAPAFSKGMFERLWLDMRDIVREMVEEERWQERTALEYTAAPIVTRSGYTLKKGEIFVPHVVDLTLRMALAAIARAGFGMDFEWEAEESFTRVCQEFGNPHRWHWWLLCLGWIWALVDVIAMPFQFFRPVIAATVLRVAAFYQPIWNSILLAPSRIICAIVFYFLAEIWTVFARPTDADFSPRKIKVHEALHLVAKDSTLRLAIPAWMMRLPFRRMRRMRLAFGTLESELRRLTDERKAYHLRESLSEDQVAHGSANIRSDLLNNLVKAAMMDEGDLEKGPSTGLVKGAIQKGLTDDEIIGNTYIYFLAGHETTAHSLAWTLALLAAYPEHQDAVLREIDSVWPSSNAVLEPFHTSTTMDDYAKFPFVLACYSETLRLFPPVQMIPKVAAQDVSISVEMSNVVEEPTDRTPLVDLHSPLSIAEKSSLTLPQDESSNEKPYPFDSFGPNDSSTQTSFVVKKDTIIMIDPPGVHYNPRYWDHPDDFDPTRFSRPYNKDAYIPFGVGHRACLGRKFSEVESVAMLIHLLRNYSVHLAPTSPDGSVDVALAREQFSKASVRITLTPTEVPLIFRRRNRQ